MSELKWKWVYYPYLDAPNKQEESALKAGYIKVVSKSEADKVIAEKDKEIAQLQAMLEERNKQVGELKDRIAPKQSDKTLQERLNEVCEKHGVSTLQDLDWAFCESEKRHTRDNIEAAKEIEHHKYKRCLAMALVWFERAENSTDWENELVSRKRFSKWMELAEKFKEAK